MHSRSQPRASRSGSAVTFPPDKFDRIFSTEARAMMFSRWPSHRPARIVGIRGNGGTDTLQGPNRQNSCHQKTTMSKTRLTPSFLWFHPAVGRRHRQRHLQFPEWRRCFRIHRWRWRLQRSGLPPITGQHHRELARNQATRVHDATGSVFHIAKVTSSNGNNLLVGDVNANVPIGGTGRNVIIGGAPGG